MGIPNPRVIVSAAGRDYTEAELWEAAHDPHAAERVVHRPRREGFPTVRRAQLRRTRIGAGLAALSVAGCVHYAPAPLAPETFPTAFEGRRLDDKPEGAVWSGADLLGAALARNPQVAAARAKHATALAAARTAALRPGLTLTLAGEYADEHPHWGYGAAAEVPVDAGARRRTRVTTADLQALQAWYDVGEAAWMVRTALEKARIDRQSADAALTLTERAVAVRRERLQRLERRVAAGEDDRALALAAQGDLGAAERRQADARGRSDQAQVTLARALGVAPAAVRTLSIAPVAEAPALEAVPAWRREAVLSRSDVLRAIADYDIAENALRLEVARQYPEARIGPGYTYDHGVNKLPLSLSLVLPTYDLNRRAIDQAEAGRVAAGRAMEAVQANALSAVDAAAAAVDAARANVERLTAQDLPAAGRAADNAARAVRAGEADRVDDLAARAALLDAELNLVDARRTAWTAAADLEDALRRSFDPAEAAVLQSAMTRSGAAR